MFDVFISYGHQDQAWVRTLAENLYREGLEVFYDEWEITAGDVLVHKLDEGIRTSHNGILVVSPTSLTRPWVEEEYAAMLTRVVAGQQRLIPVLLEDAVLPPFLASRVWVDFRHADGPEYDRRVRELVAALRGERPPRPTRGGNIAPPPRSGFRPEGPRLATLHLSTQQVTLSSDGGEVSYAPRRLTAGDIQRVWDLSQDRLHPGAEIALRSTDAVGTGGASALHQSSLLAGAMLTQAFLGGPVAERLRALVQDTRQAGSSLELALDSEDELAGLPWETLRLPASDDGEPGPPLVLHPHIELYRSVAGLGPTPAMTIAGPLRILVAIASPEANNARGELLDYEAELQRILDAVETTRREQRVYVRILNQGTVRALHEALHLQRFHVLHLSCHTRPGMLVLEDEEGQEDRVDAARFASEVLPPDRGVPLVVLSGCSTGVPEQAGTGEVALPGFARQLLEQGVPAVLAMTASVSDPYATRLAGELYHSLSTGEHPDALTAFSQARRRLEQERERSQDLLVRMLAEWATPTLFLRGRALPLYDRQAPFEELVLPLEPRFGEQMVVRQVGDFVGRRAEARQAHQALREQAGLVLHGLGGVGKSTLAAQIVATLGEEAGLVVALSGPVAPDRILTEVGKRLLALAMHHHLPESHPVRELALALREPRLAWSERLELLDQLFCATTPLLLLLDNFEDNLLLAQGRAHITDKDLAAFLASWVHMRGRAHLLVTSRYPFALPEQAERHLVFQHLGPLSWAETRKLIWRLPGLDNLSLVDQQQAYLQVGGHPRTLEYLDALLRGGQARFTDITRRMEDALTAHNLTPSTVWQQGQRGLDAALAEAITLAVDDVVLSQLLDNLAAVPLARHLLEGVAVYRLPIEDIGLGWQVGDEQSPPDNPEREARLDRLAEAQQAALAEGRQVTLETLGFSADELEQLQQDFVELARPPLQVPLGMEQAKAILLELGLLAPVGGASEPSYLVHRWTAQAVVSQEREERRVNAHHRAARYWQWRVTHWRQSREDDLVQLLEARYHHHTADELDKALDATDQVCVQLHTWGAYSWAEQLCRETLDWVPEDSHWAARFHHQLGMLAQRQGEYEEARRQYQRALEIYEQRGDRAGIANDYGQLGVLAHDQGEYEEARRQYQRALEIFEQRGDRAGMATGYHQLGRLAHELGEYEEARRQYQRALEINEQRGDRAGMATSYHQLGMLAHDQEEYEEARRQYQRALEINEQLRNRAGMATSYHQLGMLAHDQGEYEEARRQYQRSLEIKEQLGNRAGMATTYGQLGVLAHDQGDYEEAQRQNQRALEIFEQLGNRAGMATTYGQLGVLLTETGRVEEAVKYTLSSLLYFLQAGAPQARTALHWLAQERTQLGETQFRTLVRKELGEENIELLLKLLDEQKSEK